MQSANGQKLCVLPTDWHQYPSGVINYYSDKHLLSGEDGGVEAVYEGTTHFNCGFRTQNANGSYSQYMMLSRNSSNNRWYILGNGWTAHMSKLPTFIKSGDRVRLERVGNNFKLYVNEVLKHTVAGSNYGADEIAGYCKTTGSNPQKTMYKYTPNTPNDLFALDLRYAESNANLNSTAQYNGNISSMIWRTAGSEKSAYGFQYDDLNRLTNAEYKNISSTGNYHNVNNQNFTVSNIGYDLNGNIQTLKRNDKNGNVMDNLQYIYENIANGATQNTNKLRHVTDAVGFKGFDDVHAQVQDNYQYTETGEIKLDKEKKIKITYHTNGKVEYIHDEQTNKLKVSYIYNERGERLIKTAYSATGTWTKKTYYVREISGAVVSIYEEEKGEEMLQSEVVIAGIGVYSPQGNHFTYQLTDHLGNVRATISDTKVNGAAEVLSYADYYPFGMTMAGRTSASSPQYRLAYQGQELDTEIGGSGFYAFELRNYDPRLGKWLSPDPYGQYWSPYLAMSNNPVSFVDPDGGWSMGITPMPYLGGSSAGATFYHHLDDLGRESSVSEGDEVYTDAPPWQSPVEIDLRDIEEWGWDDRRSNIEIKGKDVYVNTTGRVVEIIENNGSNRLFIGNSSNPNSRLIDLNDPNMDLMQLSGAKIDDQLVHFLSIENQHFFINKGKSLFIPRNLPIVSEVWGLISASYQSRGGYRDFGFSYLAPYLAVEGLENYKTYKSPHPDDDYSTWDVRGGFIFFEGAGRFKAYNIPDAGNFLWGAAMNASNISYGITKLGSILNDTGDSNADQQAIDEGYRHFNRISNPIGEFFWYKTEQPSFWRSEEEINKIYEKHGIPTRE